MPALDEEAGLERSLTEATEALAELVAADQLSAFEIVVVDDGSTDATASIVARLGATNEAVRLLSHDRNRGVGAGLRTGIAAAQGDLLLYTDADMPVDLRAVGRALEVLARPEIVLVAGRRQSYAGEPLLRRVLSKVYDRLVVRAFQVDLPDINFPFKLLATDLARQLDLRSEGALADVELVQQASQHGEIATLLLPYQPRAAGDSKTMTARVLVQLAREARVQRKRLRASR